MLVGSHFPHIWLTRGINPILTRDLTPVSIEAIFRLGYPGGMKAFPDSALLQQAVPAQPGLLVLVAPYAGRENMLVIAARLALRGPLRVLDGGNRFNAYVVARMLRYLGANNLPQSLAQIQVARAFTCYQMVKLLELAPPRSLPLLVIDLLDTFYDESAPLDERRRLGQHCATRLRCLGQQAPVVVSLRPPRPPLTDPTGLLEIIQDAADQVWFHPVEEAGDSHLLRLFEET